jgi:hypothetical protein
MKIRQLNTFEEVVEKIGIDRLLVISGRAMTHFCNWRADRHFPCDTYLVIQQELALHNCTAPAALWPRMIQPKIKRAA